jgi:Asparagine synthase
MAVLDGPVPTVLVSDADEHYRRARALGRPTNLTGEIAEFVVEMSRFVVPHLIHKGRLSAVLGLWRDQFSRSSSPIKASAAVARQLASAAAPRSLEAAFIRHRRSFRGARLPEWLDRTRIQEAAVENAAPPGRRWEAGQLLAFVGPGLSLEADEICQSLHGVMVRRPWADVDLWELFLSLPAEDKYPTMQSKALVRRLLRGRVPDEILDRTDKTVFNDDIMARIDYGMLRQWLMDPAARLTGVDYAKLAVRLEQGNLSLMEFMWAKDLAAVHAFMRLDQ